MREQVLASHLLARAELVGCRSPLSFAFVTLRAGLFFGGRSLEGEVGYTKVNIQTCGSRRVDQAAWRWDARYRPSSFFPQVSERILICTDLPYASRSVIEAVVTSKRSLRTPAREPLRFTVQKTRMGRTWPPNQSFLKHPSTGLWFTESLLPAGLLVLTKSYPTRFDVP